MARDTVLSTSRTDAAPAEELLDAFGTFVKAVSIYPDTNERVQLTLARLLAATHAARADERCAPVENVPIVFDRDKARVGRVVVELRAETNAAWLRERFERTLLAGVELEPVANERGLLAFSHQLLDHYARSQLDQEFDNLWPDAYSGVKLKQRLFEGTFSQSSGGGISIEGLAPLPGTEQQLGERLLADRLAKDPEVEERLQHLEACFEAASGPGEATRSFDLLSRLVDLMPADMMQDLSEVRSCALEAIEALAQRFAGAATQDVSEVDDAQLNRLLLVSGRRFFARQGPSPHELVAADADESDMTSAEVEQQRARDEEVVDDLGLFLAEIRELPPMSEDDVLREIESTAEQLGVGLHYLALADDVQQVRALRPMLRDLLRSPGTEELALIATDLRRHPEEEEKEWWTRFTRITSFLTSEGLAGLVRKCGELSLADVIRGFPRHFVLFLQSIDVGDRGDCELLANLGARVSPQTIQAAAPTLVREGLLESGLPERLLSQPVPGLLPLVAIFLHYSSDSLHEPAVAYLKNLGLTAPESCLLRIFDRPADLAPSYLTRLIDRTLSEGVGRRDPSLVQLVGSRICEYLRETRGDVQQAERRAYALHSLISFPVPEARDVASEILQAKRALLVPSEPKIVRQAARRLLDRS